MAGRDRDLFAEFVAARSGALHRAAYLMVGDVGLAQDLVQEALTKTYIAWPRLRDPLNAEAYTRKAITTTAITWFRRRSWSERPSERTPERVLAGHADAVTDQSWLADALRTLPPRQRAAVVLRYYEDLSEAETAAALGCAVGTVKSQVSAGLTKLRDRLREDPALVPAFVPVDSREVAAAAEGRLRRRRAMVGGGVVAVVLAAAVLVAGLRVDAGRPEPAPSLPVPPTWASGTSIHDGDIEIEIGHRVDAFVRTTSGFVVASRGDVWSVTGSSVSRVGTVANRSPRLVADEEGSLVAWLEPDDTRSVRYLDQANGTTGSVGGGSSRVIEVLALDGTSAYVREADGIRVLDLAGGASPTPEVSAPGNLIDVEDGVRVVDVGDDVRVGTDTEGFQSLGDLDARVSDLSPDARWLAVPSGGASVYDVRSGERVPIPGLRAAFALPYGWSGPDTVLVLTGDEALAAATIVACSVSGGTCADVATLPSFAQDVQVFKVQLPTGRPLADF